MTKVTSVRRLIINAGIVIYFLKKEVDLSHDGITEK